jgi:HK97 family phage portal protein
MAFWTRAIRPDPSSEIPNDNPAGVPPASVGAPDAVPGDPHGVELVGDDPGWAPPPTITPSAWSGWPADWATPYWGSPGMSVLTDTAWMCLDRNSSVLAAMPPYLVNAASTLSADWLNNPNPAVYTDWREFLHQFAWDYQLGEAFVLATSRYSTGWPSRFHVVAPWYVNVEIRGGLRYYDIGGEDVTDDILHVRYKSQVGFAHGIGPLTAGSMRMVADQMLTQYGTKLAITGVPTGVLTHPANISQAQAQKLQADWVAARASTIGEPAVLGGGITWAPTQLNPSEMGLLDLLRFNQSRIAELLGIPPVIVGLPSGGDPMTYRNVAMLYDQHWRSGLRPKAAALMSALSGWALPRGTVVELNSDDYVQGEPLERAQAYQILASIVDPVTGQPAMTVDEIRAAERLDNSTPTDLAAGVLK